MGTLGYYVLKLERPVDGWGRLPELTAHAREASEALRNEGLPVRFLRSIFVPEEETCFYLFEADSADDVREAARRAHFPSDNVAEAITAAEEERR